MGKNTYGEIGNGETSSLPILIPSLVLMADGRATTWISLTVGDNFTCGTTTVGVMAIAAS